MFLRKVILVLAVFFIGNTFLFAEDAFIMIDGVKYQADSVLYENGTFVLGMLAENTKIDGIVYKAGCPIAFKDSGKVSSGTVAETTTIDSVTYSICSRIIFDENGKVSKTE